MMLTQWLFHCGLLLVGSVLGTLLDRGKTDLLAVLFMAYPLGLLAWVLSTLGILCCGIPFNGLSASIAISLFLAGAAACHIAFKPIRERTYGVLLLGCAVFAVVAALVHLVNLTLVTNDSFFQLIFARSIGLHGGFTPINGLQLSGWGVFTPLLHATST